MPGIVHPYNQPSTLSDTLQRTVRRIALSCRQRGLVPQSGHDGANVLGLRLLVINPDSGLMIPNSTKVRHHTV